MQLFKTLKILSAGFIFGLMLFSTANAYTFTRDLSVGAQGEDVKVLQGVLVGHKLLPTNKERGIFDEETKQAFLNFQKYYFLEVLGFKESALQSVSDGVFKKDNAVGREFKRLTTTLPFRKDLIPYNQGKNGDYTLMQYTLDYTKYKYGYVYNIKKDADEILHFTLVAKGKKPTERFGSVTVRYDYEASTSLKTDTDVDVMEYFLSTTDLDNKFIDFKYYTVKENAPVMEFPKVYDSSSMSTKIKNYLNKYGVHDRTERVYFRDMQKVILSPYSEDLEFALNPVYKYLDDNYYQALDRLGITYYRSATSPSSTNTAVPTSANQTTTTTSQNPQTPTSQTTTSTNNPPLIICAAVIRPAPAQFLTTTNFVNNGGGSEVETLRNHMVAKGFLGRSASLNPCGEAQFDSELIKAINRYKTNNKITKSSSLLDPVTFSLINSELGYPDKVHPSVPAGYSFCSVGGKTCSFSGTKDVIYGTDNKYSNPKINQTNSIDCSISKFGDPVKNKSKACYVKDSTTVNPPTTAPVSVSFDFQNVGEANYTSTGQKTIIIYDTITKANLPTLTWTSSNATTYDAYVEVNNKALCGLSATKVDYPELESNSGSLKFTSVASARIGCELKIVLIAKNSSGQTAKDSVLVKYERRSNSTPPSPVTPLPSPTASLKINGAKEFTMTPTSALPTIEWSSTNGSIYSAKLNVNSSSSCKISSGTPWTFGGNTASGSYRLTTNDASSKIGCDTTLVYTVKNANNQTVTDSIVIKYRADSNQTTPTTPPQAPTASLKINGKKEIIYNANTPLPTVTWDSTNGDSYVTKVYVNNSSLCDNIQNGTVWSVAGKTASGSYTFTTPERGKIGCDLTLTYTVTPKIGNVVSDSIVIKYRDVPPPPSPTASLKINGAKEFTMTPTSALPTIEWSSTNGSTYSTVLNVNSATNCLIQSGTNWPFGGNTASGSYTLRTNDASSRIGCDMTFVYKVKNANNETVTDSVVIKYRASASPTSLNRTLKVGDEGTDVAIVQETLKKKGFFNGDITGFFGRLTSSAVSAFQQANALEAVGEVGPKTKSLLNSLLGN